MGERAYIREDLPGSDQLRKDGRLYGAVAMLHPDRRPGQPGRVKDTEAEAVGGEVLRGDGLDAEVQPVARRMARMFPAAISKESGPAATMRAANSLSSRGTCASARPGIAGASRH